MLQVLFRIPLKADWLPFGLPFWGVLSVFFLLIAWALWLGARFAPRWGLDPKGVQTAAYWIGGAGQVVAVLAFLFADSGLPIYGFGMMLFLAFVVCNWLAARRAGSEGVPRETIQDLAIWIIVGGLVGARLTSFLSSPHPPTNVGDFLYQFIRIWDGGIVLYGAVIGGALSYVAAYLLVFRKQGVSTLKIADVIAPSLAVGLCLGRIGCFLNGCCYGQVACTDCPVYAFHFPLSAPPRYDLVNKGYQTAAGFTLAGDGIAVVDKVEPGSQAERAGLKAGDEITAVDGAPLSGNGARYADLKLSPAENLGQYLGNFGDWPRGKNDLTLTVHASGEEPRTLTLWPRTLGLHPTQLYESVSMALLFLLLTAYYPFRRHDGQVMALLMICYAAHRYVNELLRADERPEGFESWTSVILFAAGLVLMI